MIEAATLHEGRALRPVVAGIVAFVVVFAGGTARGQGKSPRWLSALKRTAAQQVLKATRGKVGRLFGFHKASTNSKLSGIQRRVLNAGFNAKATLSGREYNLLLADLTREHRVYRDIANQYREAALTGGWEGSARDDLFRSAGPYDREADQLQARYVDVLARAKRKAVDDGLGKWPAAPKYQYSMSPAGRAGLLFTLSSGL